jgi:ferritin
MVTESVLMALNFQLNHEITNFYTYKMFSGIADAQGLLGATSWFAKQADEEKAHFEKFHAYISDQGHIPHLLSIPEIKPEMLTLEELFSRTVILESGTTVYLKALAQICKQELDDQTYELVLWYLKEQVEEEKTVQDMLARVKLSASNLLVIDHELGER